MATTSAQFSLTLRVEVPHESGTLGKVTQAITRAGGAIVAVDTVEAGGSGTLREITIDCESQDHRGQVIKAVRSVREAKLVETTDRTFEWHRGGKIHTGLAVPVKTRDYLSMAYTPGVARGIAATVADEELASDYIIPSVFNRQVSREVAEAVAEEAERAGAARSLEETPELSAPT
jgi:malate dehydrogenase (oxaloacetate-decarboxylating)